MKQISRALLVCVICLASISEVRAQDPAADYPKIREGMSKLGLLVGSWKAIALFHDGDTITENEGSYEVGWALEKTYLECRVELHRKNDPSHHHAFLTYITYNPATHQYQSTYLYSRWALRVTETGEYDEARHEFRTSTLIPLEDGAHDENVRTITDLNDPAKIVYTHYSRYSNQATERMDVQITLTPQPQHLAEVVLHAGSE